MNITMEQVIVGLLCGFAYLAIVVLVEIRKQHRDEDDR